MAKDKSKSLLDIVFKGKKLSLKEKSSPLLVIAVVAITSVLVLIPSGRKIYDSRKVLIQKKETLQNLKQKNKILHQLTQNETEQAIFDKNYLTVEDFLPSHKPSLQTLINLTYLARQEKVQFSGLKLNPGVVKEADEGENQKTRTRETEAAKAEKSLSNFEISFTITGQKNRLQSFVSKLKGTAPLMKIEEFSTSVVGQNQTYKQTSLMTANLKIKVFYQKMPETLPAYSSKLVAFNSEEEELLKELVEYLDLGGNFSGEVNFTNTDQLGNSNPFSLGPGD